MRRKLFVFLMILIACGAHAQGYRGRDFWICFPQNAVLERADRTLELSLFIASENRANVTIANLLDSSTRNFTVESGGSIEREIDTEIEDRSSELIGHNALHITSDHDISVYVVDHRPASTDSYMAIPTEYLGKEYVAAGYATLKNGFEGFTSQASVIATENNTLVSIHLTGTTRYGLRYGEKFTVPLNRGETYQIQGRLKDGDLTGSTVSATKPIAFFTGHSCAEVPSEVRFCNILLEMEPPANDWGTSFILTKFEGKDYYVARVIANADSTEISINGRKTATINRGQFYEVDTFYHDAVVSTSKPALVAQYCTSTNADSVKTGDPFMLIAVPNDRFIREVTTSSVTVGVWKDYLNIVVPDTAVSSLLIDGESVGLRRYPTGVLLEREDSIPGTKFIVITYQVAWGRHLLKCAVPIAVYGYGFGIDNYVYDSYGHACGMRLDK